MRLNTKRIAAFILALLISLNIHAQNRPNQGRGQGNGQFNGGAPVGYGVISGAVHDEATGEHVEYANILLFSQRDSAMITGTITDTKGKFVINSINPGKYYLRVQFIGYENKDIPGLAINPQSADIKLGDIKIKSKSSALQGVEITSERSLISNNLDKKVITVDKNLALGGGTASDVMQNVPSVAVDAEGNISLRGNSNITLLVDGKPASQAGIAASDMLNTIPASSIESVEVITNPSVRYDPDGTTGIINIVLKKKALQGFNGLVSLNAGTGDKYNGSLVLNYRHSKFNAFINTDGRWNNSERDGKSIRTSNLGESVSILDQSDEGNFKRNMNRISGGIDYFIDTRNNLTLSVAKRNMSFGGDGLMFNRTITDNVPLRLFHRYNESDRSIDSWEYTLSYKHLFPEKGREFTNDIIVNDNKMKSYSYIDQQNFDLINNLPIGNQSKQKNVADNNNLMLTLQGNYVYPMANGSRIEAGYKADARDIMMNYDYTNFNPLINEWESQLSLNNRYDYNEQIYAVYGIYANSWKKLKYQGGLRVEQAYTNSVIDQTDVNRSDTSFKTQYASLYPSLHLQYDIGNKKELQLSYSRRVRRAGPREMNPYVDYADSLNLRSGNPALKPEFTNSLEFGLTKYWETNSISGSLFYRYTNDEVEDVTTLLDAASGVTMTRPLNVSEETNYGLEIVTTINPAKWLRTNANLSFYQAVMSDIPEYNIEGSERFTWSARINMTFGVWKDGSFQMIANYNSPRRSLQEYMEDSYSADISFRQDLMKKKLSLSMRLTDIFDTRRFEQTIYGNNFTTISNRHMESRVLYFGIQYQINNFNKKANRSNGSADESEMDF
ncbi:MAG TPA: TonB-dependent receptor [Lentimicrobium sp.]|nr:TonB-dependent receptor [Lentimicrobium sp.]